MSSNLADRLLCAYARAPNHPFKIRIFDWICRVPFRRRPLELVVAGGLRMRLRHDEFVERTLIVTGWHEPLTTRLLLNNVAAGQTVLIAGAHTGYFVMQAARTVGPAGRVIACEPVPDSLAATLVHLRLNGLADRTRCLCVALGGKPGHTFLAIPDRDFCMTSLTEPATAGTSYLASVITITDAVEAAATPTPDVILLDIEGFEWTALRGIGTHRPRLLILESDPRFYARMGETQAGFFQFLEGLGYRLHSVLGKPIVGTGFFTENNIVAVRTDQPSPAWPGSTVPR